MNDILCIILNCGLLILMEPPLYLELITQTKSSGFFSQSIKVALQMFFSFLINSNGMKYLGLLDSILTHLYATTKFLQIWVSKNPISSHLVQSKVTSSTLIPNETRRLKLYIRFVNSISMPAEMKKRWSLFSTHVRVFFLAVCILWNGSYSVHGIHRMAEICNHHWR